MQASPQRLPREDEFRDIRSSFLLSLRGSPSPLQSVLVWQQVPSVHGQKLTKAHKSIESVLENTAYKKLKRSFKCSCLYDTVHIIEVYLLTSWCWCSWLAYFGRMIYSNDQNSLLLLLSLIYISPALFIH